MSYYGDRDRGDRSSRGGEKERPNPCRLYIGNISRYVRESDIRDMFGRFGKIKDLLFRDFYCFIEFHDVRDADDATKELNGHKLEGERLIVQVANKARDKGGDRDRDSRRDRDRDRGRDRDREYSSRRRDDNGERCYNCGDFGHIANECSLPKGSGERAMRFQKGVCFECGGTGHRARDCPDRDNRGRDDRGRDRDRSRRRRSSSSRSRSPRRRSRSNRRNRSTSPRRSRSPAKRSSRRSRTPERSSRRRSGSRSASRTPRRRRASPSPSRSRSPVKRRRSGASPVKQEDNDMNDA